MMEAEVQRDPTNQPTLEIDTNDDADYGILAKVLATARNAADAEDRFREEVDPPRAAHLQRAAATLTSS